MRLFDTFRSPGLAVSILLAAASPALAQEHISRSQLDSMFLNIRASTPWNIDGALLWGYFFISTDRAELQALSAALISGGYRSVAIDQVSDHGWRLHVEKLEHHSVESLYQRNTDLHAMAAARRAVVYDGMDVGPAN